eukprot:scpid15029/ scgid11407/ Macrophage mannose receptor 1; C-type lectin domain family 13 member D; C-type lectin domain family 13 member D-like; Macrophage mannose receptor 1-like protein 1
MQGLLAFSLALLAVVGQAQGNCQAPWTSSGTSCYLVVNSKQSSLTWSEARQTCVSNYGAELVSINSPTEQQNVYGLLQQSGEAGQVWIGISDRKMEGIFAWSDGSGNLSTSTSAYSHWLVGEPNNANNEDCGVMTQQGFWNDVLCSTTHGYVCERTLISTVPPPLQITNFTIANSTDCGGWYSHTGYCYKYYSSKMTFVQAEASCFQQGATLVTILTQAELNYIKAFAKTQHTASFYLALNDRLKEGTFTWDDGTLTGQTSSVTNWGKGEPNDNGHSEDCAELLPYPTLTYNDLPCNIKRAYMCKRKASSQGKWPPITNPARSACPAGYNTYAHPNGAVYCYKLVDTSSKRRSWTSARTACTSSGKGFDLVSIHDHYEAAHVLQMVSKSTAYYFWTGLNDQSQEGGYVWSDGTPTDYVYWSNGQPNRYQGSQDCTMFYRGSGRWNDNRCSYRSAYICKYTLKPRTLKLGTPSVNNRYCQSGWHQYSSYCYFAMPNTNVTHNQASTMCAQMQANLTSINSYGEQAFVMSIMGLHNASVQVHIGINDMKREGEFTWTDGSIVRYTNWGFNQPNDWRRTQDCTLLNHRLGLWNDINCNTRIGYVCKKVRDQPTNPATISNACQPGWQMFKGQCYLAMTKTALSQPLAQQSCHGLQNTHGVPANLATISSTFVNYFLSSLVTVNTTMFTPASRAYWFGLNDQGTEGTYQYTSNMPITHTNWARGQPNNWRNGQDCVEFWSSTGKWNDNNCSVPLPYICQMYNNSILTVPPPPTPRAGTTVGNCAQGWVKHNTMCYGFFGSINKQTLMMTNSMAPPTTALTWTDAQASCRSMGTNLVSIHSSDTMQFLISSANAYTTWFWFWTGLSDRVDEGGYVWADGSPVTYTNWSTQQPNDYSGAQDCVETILVPPASLMNSWNDYSCAANEPYVCEYPLGQTPISPTVAPFTIPPGMKQINCPAGWTSTPTQCYRVMTPITAIKNTFSNAERKCKAMNVGITGAQPHLASIHSSRDHLTIAEMLMAQANASNVTNTQFWVGLQDRGTEGSFAWTDNSTVDYVGWSSDQPNNWRNTQDCVEIRIDSGYGWNDQACSNVLPYICGFSRFIPSGAGQPTSPPPFANLNCNPGWKKFGSSCYREFSDVRMGYDEAYINCTQQGGDLLIVNSKAEQKFVTGMVTRGDVSEYVWMGLSDQDRERYWRWADGTPLSRTRYSNWGPSQPNNYKNEDCVAIHSSDSMWYDRSCDEPHSFVCEVTVAVFNYTSPTVPPTGNSANAHHNSASHGGHMSVGAEVGIAFAVIAGIAVIGVVVFFAIKRRGGGGAGGFSFSRLGAAQTVQHATDDDDDDELLSEE